MHGMQVLQGLVQLDCWGCERPHKSSLGAARLTVKRCLLFASSVKCSYLFPPLTLMYIGTG